VILQAGYMDIYILNDDHRDDDGVDGVDVTICLFQFILVNLFHICRPSGVQA
jgi:hypothetical protein